MVVPGALERRELRCIEISEIDAVYLGAQRSPGAPVEITSIGSPRTSRAISL